MKACAFCAGMRGELPLAKVYEDEEVLAFLDHKPVFPGHVLLIPKRHMVTLDELLPDEVPGLFNKLRVLSRALPAAMGAQGCFVANNNIVSQSVPHMHWHAVPRSKGDGLKGFFWPRQPYSNEEERQRVRQRVQEVFAQELILDLWFGPGHPSADSYTRRWFAQDPLFDGEIRRRFGALVEEAVLGGLQSWESTPRGRLALLLLLDQFTRNLFRHTGRAFVGDPRARQLARETVEGGLDRELTLDQRIFTYLPFEHGESTHWQEISLKHFAILVAEAPTEQRQRYQMFQDSAIKHADIMARFGRFPHRNEALGRTSTPAERDFSTRPGSSFW